MGKADRQKRRGVAAGLESDETGEENLDEQVQHRQSDGSEHDKQLEEEHRPTKRHRSSPAAFGDQAGPQQHEEAQQTAEAADHQTDEDHEAKPAQPEHTDIVTAADTPFAAANPDPAPAEPVADGSSPVVRQSSRQPKPTKAARQASGMQLKATASVKASGSLDKAKPPRRLDPQDEKDKKYAKQKAYAVWRDVPKKEWGLGMGGTVEDKPAAPVMADPPRRAAAVGSGFWQFFEPSPDSDEESNGGEEKNSWFRGMVAWYDQKEDVYWLWMEDGEIINDQDVDDWHDNDMPKGEVILCRLPQQQQDDNASMEKQPDGQQAAAAGASASAQKKRKRSNLAPQQQQQQSANAVAEAPAAADAFAAAAAAVKEEDPQQAAEEPAGMSASAALAITMPEAEPAVAQEHKPQAEERQQQQHKKQAQRKGAASGGKAQQRQQQQQPVTSPRAAGPSSDAPAASGGFGGAQRPRSAGGRQQQQQQQQHLDLSGLNGQPRKLAEHLQRLQEAHRQLRNAQQQVADVLKDIGNMAHDDAAAFPGIVRHMSQQLNGQQQQQQEQKEEGQQTKGPGSKLLWVLKSISLPDKVHDMIQTDASKCIAAARPGGSTTASAAKQGGAAGQQQQRRAGSAGPTGKQQQQQQSKPPGTPTKAPVKQEVSSAALADKQKLEKEAAAAAAEIAALQAALKKQETALAAAERAAAERSQDLKLLDRFKELVPLHLLDSPLRDKAVAMLAALLHPPALMSPYAIAHQIEARLHEQHGLVGTGKLMYLQHLHLIWNVLGGKELEAAADAAVKAEEQASAAVVAGQKLDAAEVASNASRAAEAAVAAAKAAIVVEPGVAEPSAVRGALLEGKLTIPELFQETAAALGFDQQRDK